MSAITIQLIRPGYWVSSLIEYGWKGNACLTEQTSQPIKQQAYPSLYQSLVRSPIPVHKWTPSNLKCLHAFHLFTYGDLVTWDRASSHWSWREVNGPKALEGALHTLALPLDTAVPLLFPGKPGTSLQTNFSLALAQLPKFCSPTFHPRRGDTRSRSCIDAGTSLLRRHRHLLGPFFVTPRGLKCTTDPYGNPRVVPRDLWHP